MPGTRPLDAPPGLLVKGTGLLEAVVEGLEGRLCSHGHIAILPCWMLASEKRVRHLVFALL